MVSPQIPGEVENLYLSVRRENPPNTWVRILKGKQYIRYMDDCGRCEGDELPTYEIEARILKEEARIPEGSEWIVQEKKNPLAELLAEYFKK